MGREEEGHAAEFGQEGTSRFPLVHDGKRGLLGRGSGGPGEERGEAEPFNSLLRRYSQVCVQCVSVRTECAHVHACVPDCMGMFEYVQEHKQYLHSHCIPPL